MKKLYRQVYFYTVSVVMVSIILAVSVAGLLFNRHQQGFVKQMIHGQVVFIRQEIQKVQRAQPHLLPERLAQLSKQLSWNMAYWYNGQLIYSSVSHPPDLSQIRTQRQIRNQAFLWADSSGHRRAMTLRVFPRSQKGVLWLEPRWAAFGKGFVKGPLLGVSLLLLFLGLLLIPLTHFLLRPYKELQLSIERLSTGNFHEEIPPHKYKAFKPLIVSFNQMQHQLLGMMQQKQRLVADVSHELRSPLTRMRLALEILKNQSTPDGSDTSLIDQSIGEVEELDHIIEDVLEVSRLQLKGIKLTQTKIDLTLFFFELLEDYELSFEKDGVSLDVKMPNNSVWLEADARLLKRLFSNLLSNALKYVPAPAELFLSLSDTPKEVHIQLKDNGPGISEAHIENIFTPFYRLENSRNRGKGGVGLGLAIVYEIIQAHKGRIHISNCKTPETGLILDIYLPHSEADTDHFENA